MSWLGIIYLSPEGSITLVILETWLLRYGMWGKEAGRLIRVREDRRLQIFKSFPRIISTRAEKKRCVIALESYSRLLSHCHV